MAKLDYKSTSLRTIYKNLVSTQKLTKVSVPKTEQRTRAELLDALEELFQTNGNKDITAEKLRSFLHILVKSTKNSLDDI